MIIPVSYTHLDVYKRQVLRSPQHILKCLFLRTCSNCFYANLLFTRSKTSRSVEFFSCKYLQTQKLRRRFTKTQTRHSAISVEDRRKFVAVFWYRLSSPTTTVKQKMVCSVLKQIDWRQSLKACLDVPHPFVIVAYNSVVVQ